jgi:hypothetical protein
MSQEKIHEKQAISMRYENVVARDAPLLLVG